MRLSTVPTTGSAVDTDGGGALRARLVADAYRVFNSFYTSKAHRLGPNLPITRAVITQHGGRIGAANRPGGASGFRATLPLAGGLS